jgi:hypothetical protein
MEIPRESNGSIGSVVLRQLLRDFGPWVLVGVYVLFRFDQHLEGLQKELQGVSMEAARLRVVVERFVDLQRPPLADREWFRSRVPPAARDEDGP